MTMRPPPTEAQAQRFWSKVDKTGNCWLWTSPLDHQGYAQFSYTTDKTRRFDSVHRLGWILSGRFIPPGLEIDHLCRVRHCVNPDHLEVVTRAENLRRSSLGFALTGMCRQGLHDMTDPRNVYASKDGSRPCCRPCKLEATRRWHEKQRLISTGGGS